MERNKLFIQPFEFGGFLETKWDSFVNQILSEARHRAQKAAYSMGGGEVPKMNLLPGEYTADQKHLTQFHPETLNHAIHRRYGRDLLRLGQHWDVNKKLPEDADRADKHDLEVRKPGKVSKEYEGHTLVRRYKNVLSDILTDEEYKDLDDEQKKAYDEAKDDPSKLVHVTDPDTGESIPKLKLRVYTGHSHLGNALSAPAKVVANQHENPGNKKFKPGIGLNDIEMIDKETGAIIEPGHPKYEEHAKKVKEYLQSGHGLYDFDLSDVLMVPREKFLNMEDYRIVRALAPRWQKVFNSLPKYAQDDGSWKYDADLLQSDPQYSQLEKEIEKKRKRMLEEPGHSMSGYEPIKNEKATGMLTDWMRANALGILGPRLKEGETVKDPVTGKMVKVHLMPYEKAVRYFGGRNLTVGFDPNKMSRGDKQKAHPGDVMQLDIPVIPRWVSYEDLRVMFPHGVNAGDAEGGEEKSLGHNTQKIWVPYLRDTKILPKVQWTDKQKAIMAHRAEPDLLPGFEENRNEKLTDAQVEELVKRYKAVADERFMSGKNKGELTPNARKVREASTSVDVANIMNNWDLLSDEQKEHIIKNSRNLVQHAKAMHGGINNADIHSHTNYSHGMGYNVNKASPGMPHLGLTAEQIQQVEKKYGSEITEEVVTGANRWFFGHAQGNKLSKAGKQGAADAVVGSVFAPQYVVKAMYNKSDDLMHIAKLYIMAFLNDYKMGIYDPEVGLSDPNKSEKIMKWAAKGQPAKGGKQERILKVQSLLTTLSGAAIGDVPPKRHRGSNAIEVQGGEDAKGKAFDPSTEDKERSDNAAHVSRYDSKRAAKMPEGMLVSAKGHLGNVEMPEIVQNIRQIVKQNLGADRAKSVDLMLKRYQAATIAEADLTREYDEKFSKEKNPDGSPKYKTEEEREKAVDDYVHSILPEFLKTANKDLYGHMTPNEQEELITQLKSKKKENYVDFNFDQDNPDYVEEFTSAMEKFWDNILNGRYATLPQYNEESKKFEESEDNLEFSLQNFVSDRGEPMSPAKFVEVMQALYSKAASEATSKTKPQINQDLEDIAPMVYEAVLKISKHYTGQSFAEISKMLHQAGLGGTETSPVQQPQQPQQPTQQPQQPTQQPQMAANVIDGLLSGLTKYVGHADFIKLVDNLAARVEELKTSPNRKAIAEKIKATYETIAKIRRDMIMSDKFEYSKAEANAFGKLESLYKALAS